MNTIVICIPYDINENTQKKYENKRQIYINVNRVKHLCAATHQNFTCELENLNKTAIKVQFQL